MPSFDFIAAKPFRASLEADYREMPGGVEAGSWKSAQVMAGSVVETLLVDYLLSTPSVGRVAKDPLKMDLMEAIEICRQEKALTDRTADLCSVIRSYRNLIHPGRLIRPGEPAPDKDSATIAVTLVRIIAEELAATREKAVGLTAAIDMAVQNRLDAWIKQYVSQGDDAADKLEVVRGMRLLVDIPF